MGMGLDQASSAIRELSKHCDWAQALDNEGFSVSDAERGHALAEVPWEKWDARCCAEAKALLHKYRDQLHRFGFDSATIIRHLEQDPQAVLPGDSLERRLEERARERQNRKNGIRVECFDNHIILRFGIRKHDGLGKFCSALPRNDRKMYDDAETSKYWIIRGESLRVIRRALEHDPRWASHLYVSGTWPEPKPVVVTPITLREANAGDIFVFFNPKEIPGLMDAVKQIPERKFRNAAQGGPAWVIPREHVPELIAMLEGNAGWSSLVVPETNVCWPSHDGSIYIRQPMEKKPAYCVEILKTGLAHGILQLRFPPGDKFNEILTGIKRFGSRGKRDNFGWRHDIETYPEDPASRRELWDFLTGHGFPLEQKDIMEWFQTELWGLKTVEPVIEESQEPIEGTPIEPRQQRSRRTDFSF